MVRHVRKIKLQCPVCNSRILDSNANAKTEVQAMDDVGKVDWFPDFFQKCWKCGKEIGIRKIS